MLVIVAPGQGAQTPGFYRPWLELPGFADAVGAWSEDAQCDLVRYGTTAGMEEITDTAVAQPLLVASALGAAQALFGSLAQVRTVAGATAGHSVGELAAGVLGGILSAPEAMRLVGVRGRAMAQAAAAADTGMTAVLGGSETDVLTAIEACGLAPANVNGAGQVVAAGTRAQLGALAQSPPPGAKLRPLPVAGAFHTPHMAPAMAALADAAAGVHVADPAMVVLSNSDGRAVTSGADWLERVIAQVTAPVRWDACMRAMTAMGVSAVIELAPGGTLTALARRDMPGVARCALKTPNDLAGAQVLLAAHGRADHEDGQVPEWRLLVSPHAGTFRSVCDGKAPSAGDGVAAGTELGHVEVRRGQHSVTPPFPATIIEWLVEDGDPVDLGQPLVRLQPEGTS